jgi:hypothetical protein
LAPVALDDAGDVVHDLDPQLARQLGLVGDVFRDHLRRCVH